MAILIATDVDGRIVELESYIEELLKKPRKQLTNVITDIPGGAFLENIESGSTHFLGFFTVAGSLGNVVINLPDSAKDVTLRLEAEKGNATTSTTYRLQKGITVMSEVIQIEPQTKVCIEIESVNPIESLTIGYTFTPVAR